MVMPRSRSSGALSIWSNDTVWARPFLAWIEVIAAVSVVLPWSTCPMVPTFTCGFVRSNFAFAILSSKSRELLLDLVHDLFGLRLRYFLIVAEFHRVHRASLRLRAELGGVTGPLRQRDARCDGLPVAGLCHSADLCAARRQVAGDVAHVIVGAGDLDVHDRLENHRVRALRRLLDRH